jgi:acrosin
LESLEDRTVLSPLVIDDGANANPTTWLITANQVTQTVQGSLSAPTVFDATAFTGLVINAGTGGDIFNVQSTTAVIPLTINSQAADTVNLGSTTDGVQDILGDVTISNPNQLTAVSLDDSVDMIGRSVTITSAAITGLAPANIFFPHNPGRSISIKGGSGGNLVNVQSTATGTTTTWISQPPGDTAQVGQNGSVQGILGNLNLDPTGPFWSAVMVDDSADSAPRTVTITGTSITGLAPGVINYAGVQNLTVDGGSGGTQFDVQSTAAGTTTNLVTQLADNTAHVGHNGSVQGILGYLSLDPTGPSWSAVMVDDSADPAPRTVTITQSSITGLAPAAINYAGVQNLTVDGGSGGTQFDVQSTASGTTTTLVTQLADNTAHVGQNGSVQGILGNLNLDPSGPSWSAVMVDDSADPAPRTVTITQSSITGLAPADITYAGVQNLTVDGGTRANKFSVQSLPPAATSVGLNGGSGTNTLDYSQYVGDITVVLPLGTATGFTGGVSNIQNVTGSRGNDLIVGDANANVLVGGTGRNILIGGGGSDTITGGGGDNILIGGRTVWDTDPIALAAIMQEWTDMSLTFDQRVNALRQGIVVNGHTYALNRSTVMADSVPDTLNGGSGRNWFFIDSDYVINNGAGPGANDRVTHV